MYPEVKLLRTRPLHDFDLYCYNSGDVETTLFALTTAIRLLAALALETSAATSTMRLDYYHTGNVSQEMFSVDRVVVEPLPLARN